MRKDLTIYSRSLMFISVGALVLGQVLTASAQSKQSEFVVTPASLQKRLLSSNTSVLVGLNSVQKAKEEVNVARSNLLPSINASAMLSPTGAFSMANVAFLFPFLLPSNWYNLDVSESLLEADGLSFYLVQLNQYASAYSLYMTILGDMELRATYAEQAANLAQIQELVEKVEEVGIATKADLARATAATEIAKARVSQLDALIKKEVAALRKMLALSLSDKIVLSPSSPKARSEESQSPSQLLGSVLKRSPEAEQIAVLGKAAVASRHSSVYSFLTGANLTLSGSEGNWSAENRTYGASGTFGFGYFPQIRLGDLSISEIKIRQKEVGLEHARVLEETLFSISGSKKQVTLSAKAVAEMSSALQMDLAQYEVGQADLLDLLNSANGLNEASVAKLRAEYDLKNQRISLARILLVDEFAKIPKCQLKSVSEDRYWLDDVLGLGPSTKSSVDTLCRRASSKRP